MDDSVVRTLWRRGDVSTPDAPGEVDRAVPLSDDRRHRQIAGHVRHRPQAIEDGIDASDESRPASADAKTFLEAHDEAEYAIPTVAYFEILRGGARLRGSDGIADLVERLRWADRLAFTPNGACEAALVDGELASAGTEINLGDVLIAGTVLTRDTRFERIENLAVETY